jgi:uncharacterized protein (DUF779 family)
LPHEELVFKSSVGVCDGTSLWLEDGADVLVGGDDVETSKQLFARAMARFVAERDFLKLWSVISTVGVVTRVGAKVSSEAAETVRLRDRRNACERATWARECCQSRRG